MRIITKIKSLDNYFEHYEFSYSSIVQSLKILNRGKEELDDYYDIMTTLSSFSFELYDTVSKKFLIVSGVYNLWKIRKSVFGIFKFDFNVVVITLPINNWNLLDYIDSPERINTSNKVETKGYLRSDGFDSKSGNKLEIHKDNGNLIISFDNCRKLDKDGIFWITDSGFCNIAKFYFLVADWYTINENTSLYVCTDDVTYKLECNKDVVRYITKVATLVR